MMKLALAAFAVVAIFFASPAMAQGKSAEHRPAPEASEDGSGSEGGNRNVAALAGGANAAHASPTALEHANSNSMVGKIKVYVDLETRVSSGDLQQALATAKDAFLLLYPDFESLSEADRAAALATPEGRALIDANNALRSATNDRDLALAALGPNATSAEVKAYIDSLVAH